MKNVICSLRRKCISSIGNSYNCIDLYLKLYRVTDQTDLHILSEVDERYIYKLINADTVI